MPKPIKYIATIPLLAVCFFCHGQGIRFRFYRIKACSTVEKLDTSYDLWEVGNINSDTVYSPKAGTVYLPRPGRYLIESYGPLLDTAFDIRDTGLYVFRFKEPDHGLYYTGAVDTRPLYSRCDTILEGYQEYHYPDGTLEMRGTFKDGFEKDSLVTFYRNGAVKMRMLRPPKIITTTTFDSLGHKTGIEHIEHKSFMTYREYDLKQYYPNGRIKKIESSKKRLVRIKAYYQNGAPKIVQTRRYRTEYYSKGIKSITYTWNVKSDHISKSKDVTVCKTEFDTTGQVTRKTVFEEWNQSGPQPALDYKWSSWIVSVEKFEKGKLIFSVKDMDRAEYLKKYPDDDEEVKDD